MRVLMFVACVLVAGLVSAQGIVKEPEVDASEVRRRGDMVEHVLPGVEAADEWTQIASLPESDLDKFQLIVVGMKSCAPCSKLTEQWKTDVVLRDWAKPDDKAKSWANLHYVRMDDPLEQWRFKGPDAVKVKMVPTIVCQPPRSGKYGEPSDVIHQYVYTGDSRAWSASLRSAIQAYLAKRTSELAISNSDDVPHAIDENTPHQQQQIPPLEIPTPDLADERPQPAIIPPPDSKPKHDGLLFGARKESIVVVTDQKQIYGDDVESQIDATVQSMGPDADTPIYRIDLSEAKKYDVAADELPVVLRVDSRDRVKEKKLPKVEQQNKGFVFSILALIFGAVMAAKLGSAMVTVVQVLLLVIIGLVGYWVFKRLQAANASVSAPTPAATPANASAEVAELEAKLAVKAKMLEYEELTAKLAAAKKANGA